jgi:hypothetical protein
VLLYPLPKPFANITKKVCQRSSVIVFGKRLIPGLLKFRLILTFGRVTDLSYGWLQSGSFDKVHLLVFERLAGQREERLFTADVGLSGNKGSYAFCGM